MWSIALIFSVLAAAGVFVYGGFRWKAETRAMRDKLRSLYKPAGRLSLDLNALPEPVRRYFRAVLPHNHPAIATARFSHTGTFNMSETAEKWTPFTSTQFVVTNRPGFDWDARIQFAPGIAAFVHDSYINGTGILHGEALGLIPLVDIIGTPEIAQGELQRFLAESPWYPTRLLPSPNLKWEPVDAESANATLRDGSNTATLTFHFQPDGLIHRVNAAARFRTSNGIISPTPWECRVWAYEFHDGIRIPTEGEVAWLLPDRRLPYWRGHIESIEYEYEKPAA